MTIKYIYLLMGKLRNRFVYLRMYPGSIDVLKKY